MVRTGLLSGSQEHFLAYMISGLLVASAMPRYRFVHVAGFYILLATILEFGQNFSPGRDAEIFTAFISMSGALVGEVIARLVTGVWREKYGFPPPLISGPTSTTSPSCPSISIF
jgi:VanZ family protein